MASSTRGSSGVVAAMSRYIGRPWKTAPFASIRSGCAGSAAAAAAGARGSLAGGAAAVPKRVALFVEPSPFTYVCGYKNRFQTLIRYLKEQGTEVLVITPGKGVTFPLVDFSAAVEQPTEFCGAKVVSVFSFGCPFYPSMPMSFCLSPRVWRELQDFKPDVIHCCSPGVMVWAGKLFALMLNTALVLSYHTHIPKYAHKYGMAYLEPALWNLIKFLHRGVDLTLVTSHAIAAEFEAEGTLQGGQTPEVWRRGVDSDTFNPAFKSAAGRAALLGGAPDDSPLIVHIGRLGFEKNLEALKEIMPRVLAQVPNARLAIVGDGPAREFLEGELKGLPVHFTGMITGDDLSAAYASADVFITPSESETLGFVVLEAMASGVPVVAPRAGGIPDIVNRSGENGFLYPAGDVEVAATRLVGLLQDPELRERVGRAGRAEVENYDWRASVTHLLRNQYTQAVERRLKARAHWLHKFFLALQKFVEALSAILQKPLVPQAGG